VMAAKEKLDGERGAQETPFEAISDEDIDTLFGE